MTKHTDTSRSTDSGVSGNAQTGAREIRGWWLIYFEDADGKTEIFTDETTARKRFKACQLNWNCHLFKEEKMKDANDPTSQSEDDTKFYQKIEADLGAEEVSGLRARAAVLESENKTLREDSVKAKRIAYAIAQVERLRRELETAKHNLRLEQGYSQ